MSEQTSQLQAADIFSVDGRVAIVTGASSGFGARFARVLHAGGATVVVTARRGDRLDALADDLGPRIIPVTGDVTNNDDLARVVAAASEVADGRIDVLVNNAGIGNPMPAEDEPVEHWRKVMDVNLNSAFFITQLVARGMLARRSGSVINIASMLGLVASSPIKQASYSASKGAMVNLTRELGCQWGRSGVRVNAIAPGWFNTEMTAEKMFADERSMQFVTRNCPMARGGAEQELDGALLFLASDASTYVTGHTLVVDGGWSAR